MLNCIRPATAGEYGIRRKGGGFTPPAPCLGNIHTDVTLQTHYLGLISAGHRMGSRMNQSGNILENYVRIIALIAHRVIGRRCEIVCRSAA